MTLRSYSHAKASPRGMTAIGFFLLFGAAMACLAGSTLTWRGTRLDHIWILNPHAYAQLAPLGKAVGIPFLLLSAALALTAMGWFYRRLWGWQLAVAIIAIQLLGDFANIVMGRVIQGGIGIAIGAALLIYLLRPDVKSVFDVAASPR